jgi:hypothetical protein
MSLTPPTTAPTLGSELERDRLERRVRRARFAIAVLRDHHNKYPARPGGPPKHLRHAISDFESQIETMNARLRDLAPQRASRPSPAMGRLR